MMSEDVFDSTAQEAYWEERYLDGRAGWDIGAPSDPLQAYLDQLTDKGLSILIPGAGNGYEAEYAWKTGFTNVHVLDIAPAPLRQLKERVPEFPKDHLIQGNFFHHAGAYDLILEQTFFCSFQPDPATRAAYFRQMFSLLKPDGKLVGLWFAKEDIGRPGSRPFGGTREEYLRYLSPYFTVRTLETAHNSIAPRAGNELFGILERRPVALSTTA